MNRRAMFALAAALTCSIGSAKSKLSSELIARETRHTDRSGQIQVIVQWSPEASANPSSKIGTLGGTVLSDFPETHSGVYSVPETALTILSADPDVKFVSVDRKIKKKAAAVGLTPATVNAQAAWTSGFNGTGIGVAVLDSGINQDDDLGVLLHGPVYTEDFTVPATAQSNGKGSNKTSSYGQDWYGHGQHIAGIIASNGKSSSCGNCTQMFAGIAPGVSLIDLKVLDTNGEGSDSYVIAAINRAIGLKATYNIRVMNLSLGRPVYESYTDDPLCQAVEAAWKAGIVVVVSAGNDGRDNSFGNDGYGTINAPGNDPYVITVGAMKSMGTATRGDDLVASYSSKGPTAVDQIVKPDLVAPGNQIASLLSRNATLPLSNPQNLATLASYTNSGPKTAVVQQQPTYDSDSNNQPPAVKVGPGYSSQYFVLSGTSMATAVVSGAAADLLQANPQLNPDQVKILLMRSASKTFPSVSTVVDQDSGKTFTSYYDIFTIGAGYLDLQAALALVKQVPAGLTAMSPQATYDGSTGEVDLVYDPSSVFSDKAMWGASTTYADKAMWGANSIFSDSVLSANKAMWGASSVWGASSDMANKAMWGASAIWSNKALWGASSLTSSMSTMVVGEQ